MLKKRLTVKNNGNGCQQHTVSKNITLCQNCNTNKVLPSACENKENVTNTTNRSEAKTGFNEKSQIAGIKQETNTTNKKIKIIHKKVTQINPKVMLRRRLDTKKKTFHIKEPKSGFGHFLGVAGASTGVLSKS